jgi:TrbL/VirB6 plasmid conjugal transfer protein
MLRAPSRRRVHGPAHASEPARFACVALVAVLATLVPATLVAQTSIPDFYSQIGSAWARNSRPYAIGLFSALFVVDVAIIYLDSVDDRGGPEVTFIAIGRRLVLGGLGLALFLNPEYFSIPLVRAFESAGTAIGGAGVAGLPDPLVILFQGWDAFSRLVNAIFIPPELAQQISGPGSDLTGILEILRALALWVWYITSLGAYLLGVGIAAAVMFFAFAVLAMQVLLVKAQGYFLINVGLLFVGGLGSRLTQGLAAGYLRFILVTALRLCLMGAVFSIYYHSLPYWERWIAQGLAAIPRGPGDTANLSLTSVSFQPLLLTASTVSLTAYLGWKIPGWFADFVLREVHFSAGRGKA